MRRNATIDAHPAGFFTVFRMTENVRFFFGVILSEAKNPVSFLQNTEVLRLDSSLHFVSFRMTGFSKFFMYKTYKYY